MISLRGIWDAEPGDAPVAGEDPAAARSYCGQKYGITTADFPKCVDFYVGPHIGEYVPGQAPGTTTSTTPAPKKPTKLLEKLGIKLAPTSSSSMISTTKLTKSPAGMLWTPTVAGGAWYTTPIGIGAIVLGGFLVLKKLRS